MTGANSRQVAGDHYGKVDYQHWDFVTDVKLPYLIGCGTKYVARWRNKNGVEDLEKSLHYVEKSNERLPQPREYSEGDLKNIARFTAQLETRDALIVELIVYGQYASADVAIRQLIEETLQETPTPESQG